MVGHHTWKHCCMTKSLRQPLMVPTCYNAYDEVFCRTGSVSLKPASLQAMENVEVHKVGAAEAANDWKPASVWSKTASQTKGEDQTSMLQSLSNTYFNLGSQQTYSPSSFMISVRIAGVDRAFLFSSTVNRKEGM